jgi:hypothetical protein
MVKFNVVLEDGSEVKVYAHNAQEATERVARERWVTANGTEVDVVVTDLAGGAESHFCVRVEMGLTFIATKTEDLFKTVDLTQHEYNLLMAAIRVYRYLLDFPREQPCNIEDCNDLLSLVYGTATDNGTPAPNVRDIDRLCNRMKEVQ